MGKAVPKTIKIRSKKILEKFRKNLSTDFEVNKKFLRTLDLPFSIKEQNLIAGFISRIYEED